MNGTTSEQVLLLTFETRSRRSPFLSEHLAQFVSTTGVTVPTTHVLTVQYMFVDCPQVPPYAGLVPGTGHLLLIPEGILSMTAVTEGL